MVQCRGPAGIERASLGRHGELSCDQARKKAARVIDRIKRGEASRSSPPEAPLTVAALADRYIEAHVAVTCNAHTQDIYRGSLRNHILPALGEKPVAAVGRADAEALHYALRETPRAANRALMVLSKMFSLAEAWGVAPPGGNPCRFVVGYREGARERFLTEDEYRRVGRELCALETRGEMPARGAAALRLLMLTGVPADGGAHPAVGRRGPQGGGVEAARRQDWRAHGGPDAASGDGARRHRPRSGQPLGLPRRESRAVTCRRSPNTGTGCASVLAWWMCGSTICGIPSRPVRWRWARA